MPTGNRLGIVFALCLFALAARAQSPAVASSSGQGTSAQSAPTPPGPSATFQQKKEFALSLFNNQFNLEALPIFEDLARQNPGDTDVLLGLGGCLIAHSATLKDEAAGRAERIRAREILLRAKQLGNNDGLLLNLLDNLPADGSLRYPGTPEVAAAIAGGDAAFAKNDSTPALANTCVISMPCAPNVNARMLRYLPSAIPGALPIASSFPFKAPTTSSPLRVLAPTALSGNPIISPTTIGTI